MSRLLGGGVTLIELMVVMALAGLLLAAVPPLFTAAIPALEVKSTARSLAAGLKQARMRAISSGVPVALTLDIGNRQFTVDGKSQALPESLAIDLVTDSAELSDGQTGSIRFFPDGTSSGGRIGLRRDPAHYRVAVDWLTGRIHIAAEEQRR